MSPPISTVTDPPSSVPAPETFPVTVRLPVPSVNTAPEPIDRSFSMLKLPAAVLVPVVICRSKKVSAAVLPLPSNTTVPEL
ncbi:hypothetical protein ES703_119088 [subsurface metagenome]